MKKKLNINTTQVAHDCIAYALVVELREILYWRERQQDALPMLAETMLKLLEREIPAATFARMRENDYVKQMHWRMADAGLIPYNTLRILNEK